MSFGERFASPPAVDAIIADDRKGRKNGRGFISIISMPYLSL